MSGTFSASPATAVYYGIQPKIRTGGCINPSWSSSVVIPGMSRDFPLRSFNLKLRPTKLATGLYSEISFRCNSSSRPGGAGPGENDSRSVLDAFFLGKALAEALSERIESTVGEFLSTVGRLQAEQQKQVQDFQEKVLEKAQKAKERAAREALEAQGLVPKSSASNASAVADPAPSEAAAASAAVDNSRAMPLSSNSKIPNADMYPDTTDEDPRLGVSNDY